MLVQADQYAGHNLNDSIINLECLDAGRAKKPLTVEPMNGCSVRCRRITDCVA